MDSLCEVASLSAHALPMNGDDAMRNMRTTNSDEHLTYDWKDDLIAVFLAALVFIPFIAEWFYWTRDQLGQ